MEFIISVAIGGEIMADSDSEKIIHSSIIKLRKTLKSYFEKTHFEGLDKIKINIYISGDVSSYCDKTGITASRYFRSKKECTAEFCIDKTYWKSKNIISIERQFILFVEKSLLSFADIVRNKLETHKYNFDTQIFEEIILKGLSEV